MIDYLPRCCKHVLVFLLWITTATSPAIAVGEISQSDSFHFTLTAIPADAKKLMVAYSWRPGCPVPLNNLSFLTLSYWGFDHKIHTGQLIVNKKIATETVDLFHELFLQQFPIERMEPLYAFKGNNNAAMAANNTYAFDCRPDLFDPEKFSLHSYGYAIDINALINPSVRKNTVLPPSGKAYLDRSKPVPGMIVQGDATYQTFNKYGWTWGGEWKSLQDYRHFQKNCTNPKTC